MLALNLRTKLLTAMGTAFMAIVLFAPMAQATTPAAGYERFAGCPSHAENKEIESCQLVRITSGNFKMGTKNVPIEKEIQLSGGTNEFGGPGFSFNSKGGLSKVPQKVPGGVIGLTGLTWLLEFFGSEALTLYATTELAGAPSTPLANPNFLPIKVHLTNPSGLLGNNCYVGSTTDPIKLFLTTTVLPKFSEGSPEGVGVFSNGTKVDKTFSAPGANGCQLVLFGFIPISINGLVNSQSGLPSPSGNNETVQNFTLEMVAAEYVYPGI